MRGNEGHGDKTYKDSSAAAWKNSVADTGRLGTTAMADRQPEPQPSFEPSRFTLKHNGHDDAGVAAVTATHAVAPGNIQTDGFNEADCKLFSEAVVPLRAHEVENLRLVQEMQDPGGVA